ncbi:sodium:solute symporter family protein [Gloeobacter morelensis]|uniref:Na+:solute symporter n=1 Tax=Gloeobacter morelensis MG652769 TaxID=2781736 RepID=A0ABY3PSA5_9CYAN|nr:sodium:solute symporter family protein [Gloeobacter morelensis]UFP96605.1 Na+:solute symporter [Gloeobacter morelensis MG652769]
MQLEWIDWAIIAVYFLVSLLIGVAFTGRAGKNLSEYFVSGRSVPWWLAGTSMVATTFAADTPLAVAGLVIKNGVAANWLWWSFAMGGMLTVFFFARLWRRSGVLTDIEFTELRYGGKPAALLRGFRSLYLGIAINSIIMGWVTLAMVKILGLTLGVDKWQAVVLCFVVTALYTTLSGLWGILVTDAFQFVLAMVGCIALAVFGLEAVGGIDGLKLTLAGRFGDADPILALIPAVDSPWMPVATFLILLSVGWWASWYPGAEPGGGGYVAQRVFSARSERDSLLATLWFTVAHYALRPWPWIVVALVAMALYPGLTEPKADPETGYIKVMIDVLPTGWRGLMLAAFAAAYMSTISTHLNWGTSYLINDFYKRFLRPEASDSHYVQVSRLATVLVMVLAGIATLNIDSISGAWQLLLALGAGTGPVYLLRWYWWRINAWSEIAAQLCALASYVALTYFLPVQMRLDTNDPNDLALSLVISVAITTLFWLAVTLLTQPETPAVLERFYRRVRPEGPGWRVVRERLGAAPGASLWPLAFNWLCGVVLVYGALFGVGKLIFKEWLAGGLYLAVGLAAGALLVVTFQGFSPDPEPLPEPLAGEE